MTETKIFLSINDDEVSQSIKNPLQSLKAQF